MDESKKYRITPQDGTAFTAKPDGVSVGPLINTAWNL